MPRVASDNKLTPSKSAPVQLEGNGAAAGDAGPAPSPLGPSRRTSAAGGPEDAAAHANGGGARSSDSSSLSSGSGSSSGSPVQGAPGALAAAAAGAPRPGAHQRSNSSSWGLPRRPSSGVVTGQQRQVEQELIYEKLPTDIAERCVLCFTPLPQQALLRVPHGGPSLPVTSCLCKLPPF